MESNLVDILRHFAQVTPAAPCLTAGADTLSFADLDRRANQVANLLAAKGIAREDRVAILAQNNLAHFELTFGCAKAGVILMALNWRLSPAEIGAILADGQPKLLFVDAELSSLAAHAPAGMALADLDQFAAWRDAASDEDTGLSPATDTTAMLLYTSGTTGVAKGVMIGHGGLACNARTAREVWDFNADSVNLVAMPLFHIGGIGYGMMALSQGGHTVLLAQPDPATILTAVERHGVTHAFFVPTVIQRLVDHLDGVPLPESRLKRLIYGAAPIGEALLEQAIAAFGCGFNHAYGMTETSGTVVTLGPEDHQLGAVNSDRLRSCGLPLPWVEVAIVDPDTGKAAGVGEVGEIRVRSPMTMLGYWRKPIETAQAITSDGWLLTGDAACCDADGYLYIRDRYKDMIVSGGENIYPAEIENILQRHPAVAEVAVIGVPHVRWGETPRAYVVLRDGEEASESALIEFTRERLARYKAPTSVIFVDSLPRNASGKLLKHEIRRLAAADGNGGMVAQ